LTRSLISSKEGQRDAIGHKDYLYYRYLKAVYRIPQFLTHLLIIGINLNKSDIHTYLKYL